MIEIQVPEGAISVQGGFVRLVDTMGDDMSVVRSARVSYGNESKGAEADEKLVHYLIKHNHGTPIEHINFTFHIKCPIFIARQWMRHRIGSFNEISGRYVKLNTEFWMPVDDEDWRMNNKADKQASGTYGWKEKDLQSMSNQFDKTYEMAMECYDYLLMMGLAREQARAVLPLATYTEFYWTVNARSLFNFIKLRTHEGAQKEMQDYAGAIYELAQPNAPWTFDAFEKYILN